jgi:hypothetical protein
MGRALAVMEFDGDFQERRQDRRELLRRDVADRRGR